VVGLLHGAMVGGVMVGLVCNGLGWWDLHAVLGWQGFHMVGWGYDGPCTLWWGLCEAGWHCGGTCTPCWGGVVARFLRGGLVSKLGLHTVLGRCQSSVAASLVRCDRVVAADLHVAKGGGGGHGLHAVRWQGLARLEGWDMRVGIMWWRGRGLRTWHVG